MSSPTKISTAGWVFVFAVNISMSGVDPNSPAGKAIANQLDNPGDYSISQLYADFTSKYLIHFVLDRQTSAARMRNGEAMPRKTRNLRLMNVKRSGRYHEPSVCSSLTSQPLFHA